MASRADVRARVDEVLALRIAGASVSEIRPIAAQKWGVSRRQLNRYLQLANRVLEKTLEGHRKEIVNLAIARLENLYAKALELSDLNCARLVLRDEIDLLGLAPPKRTEITGRDGVPLHPLTVELTPDERVAGIAAVLAEVGQGGGGQVHSRERQRSWTGSGSSRNW